MISLFIELFAVSILSSTAGAICGIGGGVIIKPVLDCLGIMNVSCVSFLSGCTVLAMSGFSVCKNLKKKAEESDILLLTSLAFGAAFGGIIGKSMFQALKMAAGNENFVGMIQSAVLIFITAGSIIYTVNEGKIQTKQCRKWWAGVLIGILLGILSSFLGIGGGPVNLIVLAYVFSMTTKEAVFGSLYIIMFSQITSLMQAYVYKTIPDVDVKLLFVMIAGGAAGGIIGDRISKNISDKRVTELFQIMMLVIVGINIYNTMKFGYRFFAVIGI